MSGVEIAQPLTALTRLLSPKYFRDLIITTNEGLVMISLGFNIIFQMANV